MRQGWGLFGPLQCAIEFEEKFCILILDRMKPDFLLSYNVIFGLKEIHIVLQPVFECFDVFYLRVPCIGEPLEIPQCNTRLLTNA